MTMSGSNRHEILVIVLRSSVCKAPTVLPQRCVSRAYSGRRLIAFSEVRTIHRTGSNPHTGSGNECPLYPRKRTSEPARVFPSTQQLRLGDIRRDPPRLGIREQLGRRSDASVTAARRR